VNAEKKAEALVTTLREVRSIDIGSPAIILSIVLRNERRQKQFGGIDHR
jgi:hypothetical protein